MHNQLKLYKILLKCSWDSAQFVLLKNNTIKKLYKKTLKNINKRDRFWSWYQQHQNDLNELGVEIRNGELLFWDGISPIPKLTPDQMRELEAERDNFLNT